MGVLETVLAILLAIVSVALIAIITMQSGKQAGLSGALAGGNNESYLNNGGASADKKMASATKWIALLFGILTLALNIV